MVYIITFILGITTGISLLAIWAVIRSERDDK